MSTRDRHPRRGLGHETAGAVDYPFDDDRPSGQELTQSDAACAVPWRVNGFEAIQVFVDPALRDRARELCEVVETWSSTHADLDRLSAEIQRWSERERLSASLYEQPRDDLSTGVLAIAFTLG
jgi:hypothetical protein